MSTMPQLSGDMRENFLLDLVIKQLCQDDKHVVKVGEPGLPVTAVERG